MNALFKFFNKNCFALISKCVVTSLEVSHFSNTSYFSRAKSSSSSFIFNCICISSILLFSSMFSFSLSLSLSFSSIYFNFIFSCISVSLIFSISTPKLLTNSKSSSPTISSSTIQLRISNFNMVVLTSKFNYLHSSNNSDCLVPQAPPL